MKKKKPISDPIDLGTRELGRRFTVVPTLVRGPSGGMNGRVMDDTELDRLLLKDVISTAQHATLMGFMRRLQKASYVGVRSPSLEAPVQGDASSIADRKAHLVRAIGRVLSALDKKIGPSGRKSLIDLVLMDIAWPGDPTTLHVAVTALDVVMTKR